MANNDVKTFLKDMFIDEAKPALDWFDKRWGGGSSNIIDMNAVNATDSVVISYYNGGEVSVTSSTGEPVWACTDYTPIVGGTTYYFQADHTAYSTAASVAFFNENKEFISAIRIRDINNTTKGLLETPTNAKYLRASFSLITNPDWRNTVAIRVATEEDLNAK